MYYPTEKSGFAVFVNLEGYELSEEDFGRRSPYSLLRKLSKQSSPAIFGSKVTGMRKVYNCSGIKSFPYSLKECSTLHHGLYENRARNSDNVFENSRNEEEEEEDYAIQVFYCEKNMFPIQCKNIAHRSDMEQLSSVSTHKGRQTRIPNWIVRVGMQTPGSNGLTSR